MPVSTGVSALPGGLVAGSTSHAPLACFLSHCRKFSNICSKLQRSDCSEPEREKKTLNWGNNDTNLHSPETFWSCPPSFSTGFLWCSYQDHLLFEPCICQQIIVNEFIVDSCSTWRYGSRSPDTRTSSAGPEAQSWHSLPSSNPLQTTAPLWTHSHQLNNNRLRILF